MENIYHDYWDQELMYQFLTEDKCKKKAYVCSPFSADDRICAQRERICSMR